MLHELGLEVLLTWRPGVLKTREPDTGAPSKFVQVSASFVN